MCTCGSLHLPRTLRGRCSQVLARCTPGARGARRRAAARPPRRSPPRRWAGGQGPRRQEVSPGQTAAGRRGAGPSGSRPRGRAGGPVHRSTARAARGRGARAGAARHKQAARALIMKRAGRGARPRRASAPRAACSLGRCSAGAQCPRQVRPVRRARGAAVRVQEVRALPRRRLRLRPRLPDGGLAPPQARGVHRRRRCGCWRSAWCRRCGRRRRRRCRRASHYAGAKLDVAAGAR